MSKKRVPKKVTKTILHWDFSCQKTETKYGLRLSEIDQRICLKSVTIWLWKGIGEMFIDFDSIDEIDPNDHIRIREDVRKLVDSGSFFFWQGSTYHCSRNGHHVTIHFYPQNGIDFCVTAIEKFIEIYKHFGCEQIWYDERQNKHLSRPGFPTITQETYVVTQHRLPSGRRLLEQYNLHVGVPLYKKHFPELCNDLATYKTAT